MRGIAVKFTNGIHLHSLDLQKTSSRIIIQSPLTPSELCFISAFLGKQAKKPRHFLFSSWLSRCTEIPCRINFRFSPLSTISEKSSNFSQLLQADPSYCHPVISSVDPWLQTWLTQCSWLFPHSMLPVKENAAEPVFQRKHVNSALINSRHL